MILVIVATRAKYVSDRNNINNIAQGEKGMAYIKQSWQTEEEVSSSKLQQMCDNEDHFPKVGPNTPSNHLRLCIGKHLFDDSANSGAGAITDFKVKYIDGTNSNTSTIRVICDINYANGGYDKINEPIDINLATDSDFGDPVFSSILNMQITAEVIDFPQRKVNLHFSVLGYVTNP